MTVYKPTRAATVAHTDKQIQVFTDGTWMPVRGSMRGWTVMGDAVIYASGAGDARITTAWGHSKVSKVVGPDGTKYDIRRLATGRST